MIKSILKWFKNRKEKKKKEKQYNEKLKELRKRDPFIYKH
jgi:hypothetical protein